MSEFDYKNIQNSYSSQRAEYKKQIAENYMKDLLNGRDSVSAKELKRTPLFQKLYKDLSPDQKKIFDDVAKLDNDGKDNEYSIKELNTLITLLDAKKVNGGKEYKLDGIIEGDVPGSKISELEIKQQNNPGWARNILQGLHEELNKPEK